MAVPSFLSNAFSTLSNKCHASSNRCLTSSNKKLVVTGATLVVTFCKQPNSKGLSCRADASSVSPDR